MLLATAAFWVIAFSIMIYFMLDEVRGLRRVVRMKVRDDPLRVVVSRALRDLSPLPSATTRRAVDPSDPHAPPRSQHARVGGIGVMEGGGSREDSSGRRDDDDDAAALMPSTSVGDVRRRVVIPR